MKPVQAEGGYSPTYDDLITSMEIEVLHTLEDSGYQGDTFALVRENGRLGYLQFGWGSCSGCDALQAAHGYGDFSKNEEVIKEVHELRDRLYQSIRWFDTPAECAKYMREHDWAGDYMRDTGKEFAEGALKALEELP